MENNINNKNKTKISVIIPAYNEGNRIGSVLSVVKDSKYNLETIVVNDSSTDNTSEVVEKFKEVKLINLEKNQGKQMATNTGVGESLGEILVFLDADLIGLTGEHIDLLIEPILTRSADLTISYRKKAKFVYKLGTDPCLCGERSMRKSDYLAIIKNEEINGFEFEVVCNRYFLDNGKNIKIVELNNLKSTGKGNKFGFYEGMKRDYRMMVSILDKIGKREMYRQICSISWKFQIKKMLNRFKSKINT